MTSPGIRLVEIAELLGVSKQRAHQIADEKGFPSFSSIVGSPASCSKLTHDPNALSARTSLR